MGVTKVLADVNKKIDSNNVAISIKRGFIEAIAGLIVYFGLRYHVQVDESTAFAVATFVVTAVYKYLRRISK